MLLIWIVRLVARFEPVAAVTLPLLLAAIALHSASTLAWGGADSPDGTRFKVSPIGMSHVLTPRQQVSSTVDCRWYHFTDAATPCARASGGVSAYYQLRAVYPMLWIAIALCVVGALQPYVARSRLPAAHRIVSAIAATVPALALWLFARSVGDALAALEGLSAGTGGTLGTMQVTGAILFCSIVCFVAPSRISVATASQ
jgi:hypothetical protein